MKELSIEQKAKRYDELKITAQELEHDGCFDKITLFDLFPELEESEDEKIRKEIISYIKSSGAITNKEWIDWLEKQGEQKIQRCGVSGFTDIVQAIRTVYNEESAYDLVEYLTDLVSKKEQKAAEEIEPTPIFRIGDVIKRKGKDYTFRVDRIQGGYYHCDRNYGAYFLIEDQDNWELVEQNPEWTSMDEQRVENLLAIIEGHGYPGEVAWLNSLKDRIQPKQEWSEDDEMMIKFTLAYLRRGGATEDSDIIKWLKSLRPQLKQEWREEDEAWLNDIIDDAEQGAKLDSQQIDWLKSLKERST